MLERETSKTSYRDSTAILTDILTFLRDNGAQPKSRVMGKALLSWTQLSTYGAKLLSAGLIETGQKGRWMITKKGIEFVDAVTHAHELLGVKA